MVLFVESWTARCDGGFGLLVNREEVLEKRGWGKRGGEWGVGGSFHVGWRECVMWLFVVVQYLR